jgi:hypothetical protein
VKSVLVGRAQSQQLAKQLVKASCVELIATSCNLLRPMATELFGLADLAYVEAMGSRIGKQSSANPWRCKAVASLTRCSASWWLPRRHLLRAGQNLLSSGPHVMTAGRRSQDRVISLS